MLYSDATIYVVACTAIFAVFSLTLYYLIKKVLKF